MTFFPIIAGGGLVGYRYLENTREEQTQRLADTTLVKRETEGFVEKLKNISSAEELVNDYNVLKVVLGAFGMADQIDNKALIQKALESDLSDDDSLANRMPDGRFQTLAAAFNFGSDEKGPSLSALDSGSKVKDDLADYDNANDLLTSTRYTDQKVFENMLKDLGLEQYENSRPFLKQVMESDPADSNSFVNRLNDPNLLKLAEAFDYKAKQAELTKYDNTIYSFAENFAAEIENINSSEDLLNRPDLLQEALTLFGIESAIDRTDFLTDVLESDLDDAFSVANQQRNPAYAAFANAFAIPARAARAEEIANTPAGDTPPAPYTGLMEDMIGAVNKLSAPFEDSSEYFSNGIVLVYAEKFFGIDFGALPDDSNEASAARQSRNTVLDKLLSSDFNDPNSYVNRTVDQNKINFARAFAIPQPVEGPVYPDGFAETLLEKYHSEEFLVAVGNEVPTMRFALGFEKGLTEITSSADDNNANWYSVIASPSLTEVFTTLFGLPSNFGAIDVDQQLRVYKERAENMYGTDDLSELNSPETIDEMVTRYLMLSEVNGTAGGFGDPVLSLFA